MSNSWNECLHDQRIRHYHMSVCIHFYKVLAHTGVVGDHFDFQDKSANAIAKHAAIQNYGHDVAFLQPSPDSNPFTHIHIR